MEIFFTTLLLWGGILVGTVIIVGGTCIVNDIYSRWSRSKKTKNRSR